jgi:uncharacterized membrane protein (UPF0127 family)
MKASGRPVLALVVLVATAEVAACSPSSTLPQGTISIQASEGTVSLRVQIAQTEEARQAGLMGRPLLAADAGMVFLYPEETLQPFWMKDTLIPLSVAFWDRGGRIVAMLDMIPCRADPCPLYSPHASYIGAVEVNRGFFAKHDVDVGDRVVLAR